jgi:uncharacterized protein
MIKDSELIKIFEESATIAVIGCSRDPQKDSYVVSAYLKGEGFKIIPVNPFADEILEEKVYKNISEIDSHVDIFDIFRPDSEILPIVREAIFLKPRLIWMQLGIKNNEAYKLAKINSIEVIMDKCIMVEYERLT